MQAPVYKLAPARGHRLRCLGGSARGRKIEGASTLRPTRPRSTEPRSF